MSLNASHPALTRGPRSIVAIAVAVALAVTSTAASRFDGDPITHREEVVSADGRVSAIVNTRAGGRLELTVALEGRPVLDGVRLGLVTERADLTTGLSFHGAERRRFDQAYVPGGATNGAVSSTTDELAVTYRTGTAALTVIVRASRDGIAFRYVAAVPGRSAVVAESTAFDLLDGSTLWAGDYQRNYEGLPQRRGTDELAGHRLAMPALVSTPDGRWLQLTEADVRAGGAYPAVRLDAEGGAGGVLRTALPGPDSDVFNTSAAKVRVPFDDEATTPWRVVGMAAGLASLAESSLLTDLNDAPAPELTGASAAWIKPGVSLWPWWSYSVVGADYLVLHRQYIDAAERMGFPYVTADSGYSSWDDLEGLARYGASRGVGVFAWMHRDTFRHPDGTLFDQAKIDAELKGIATRGIVGLKIDFFDSDRADVMKLYDRLSIGAGRAKLMVNFHGSTKPGGEQRTYPHVLTSEGVAGAEGFKHGTPVSARDNVNLVLGRGLLGSADATPVALSLAAPLTTQAHQLALSVAFTSALVTLADSPAAYESWPGTEMLRSLPTVWDRSLVIDAEPDSHAAFARRAGDSWYVAAITDGARQLSVPLDFLGSGEFTAVTYLDDADGRLALEQSAVTASDTLLIPLAEHGGASIVLTPGTGIGTSSADHILEAESAKIGRSARVSACASCSGGAKVGYLGFSGYGDVAFHGVEAEGAYTARIAYLAGQARRLTVSVDGTDVATVTPPESGKGRGIPIGWDVPRTIDVPLELGPGAHTIVLSAPDGYGPDLDRMTLVRTYEAESAGNILTGRAARSACEGDGCNGAMVGQLGYGASVTFTEVTARTTGTTTVAIRYASAQVRSILVRVNGGPAQVVRFPRTATWSDWSVKTLRLELAAGTNTITLAAPSDSWAPDIDAIAVAQ